jgi:hypothetical protein
MDIAVLKVQSDNLLAQTSDDVMVLALLDLSAVFGKVDHHTLLWRLTSTYGIGGAVIKSSPSSVICQ